MPVQQIDARDVQWELHLPGEKGLASGAYPMEPWKEELSDFRGRMLFEYSGLSQFQVAPGNFQDWEDIDEWADHIVGKINGHIAGCIRLLAPIGEFPSSFFNSSYPPGVASEALRQMGMNPGITGEVGRWFSKSELQRHGLGVRLVAASIALAAEFNLDYLVALFGTRTEQNRAMLKYGVQPFPNLATTYSNLVSELLQPLYLKIPGNLMTHTPVYREMDAVVMEQLKELKPDWNRSRYLSA